MQQVTTDHLVAELKDQMFARWLAEKQAQLAAAENAELRGRLDKLNAGDDPGDAPPTTGSPA